MHQILMPSSPFDVSLLKYIYNDKSTILIHPSLHISINLGKNIFTSICQYSGLHLTLFSVDCISRHLFILTGTRGTGEEGAAGDGAAEPELLANSASAQAPAATGTKPGPDASTASTPPTSPVTGPPAAGMAGGGSLSAGSTGSMALLFGFFLRKMSCLILRCSSNLELQEKEARHSHTNRVTECTDSQCR